jgi:hypothetical protein
MDIMNSMERQRLVSTLSDEPAHALGVVLKCCIGLFLLTLLVAIGGGWGNDGTATVSRGDSQHAEAASHPGNAAAHRREVFDERRARFESKASADQYAAVAPFAEANAYARPPSAARVSSQSPQAQNCSGGPDGGMDANGNQCSE